MKKIIFLLLTQLFLANNCFGLTIDRVILSTNENPKYMDFWPIVAKAWQKIGIRPTLAFIADKNVEIDESIGDVIRIEPLKGIPVSFQTQVIRLLLPALFKNEVFLISDIDMLPLQKEYFVDKIKNIPDDCFVVYRDKAYKKIKRFPMCYNAAMGKTFADIFGGTQGINNIDDIYRVIKELSKKWRNNWNTDEYALYVYLTKWKLYRKKCIKCGGTLKHIIDRRVDRSNMKYSTQRLKDNYYIDFHMPRPYKKYKNAIHKIIELSWLEDIIT